MTYEEPQAYPALTGPGDSEHEIEAPSPFRPNGREADRDASGRFVKGNRAALIAGQYSVRLWTHIEAALAARRTTILRDLGVSPDDSPEALLLAVDGLVQAAALRDSAFARIRESGGPTSIRGQRRAAYRVWCEAADRAERHLKLIGLTRRERRVATFSEAILEQPEASGE